MAKISNGNMKLGRNLMNVSQVPCATCNPDAPCRKTCYAMKAWKQYPNVRKAWTENTEQAKNDRDGFFNSINERISQKNPAYFRWHVAGDILDQDYLERMKDTARKNPNTNFLAFTKKHNLDFSDCPNNLQIVKSMWVKWGDATINGPKAWMDNGEENRIPENAIECPGKCNDCKVCWNLDSLQRDVVFKAH